MIDQKLTLPCGVTLKNRFAKSAMSENMGTIDHKANSRFESVYKKWAHGGAGLVITGNVMIDSDHLGEPRNVVIEKNHEHYKELAAWTAAGTQNGTSLWVQLNHPGKQTPRFLTPQPVAPSAIPFKAPMNKMFNTPRALTEEEIYDIIERFAYAAKIAKECGFSGVQIHGAHGYLVSQFLSPRHNQRTDEWGGSLENRMRFVLKVYEYIRKAVGDDFPVGIKLNSADFQRGGFTEEESMEVVKNLGERGMDLIEISGGTYEAAVMMEGVRESTKKREAYFSDYCEKVRKLVNTPIMLTGGFRTAEGMKEALTSGACDVIGMGRALVLDPDFPNKIIRGENVVSQVHPLTTGFKTLDKLVPLEITWYTEQIHRMGDGRAPNPDANVKLSVLKTIYKLGTQGIRRVRSK